MYRYRIPPSRLTGHRPSEDIHHFAFLWIKWKIQFQALFTACVTESFLVVQDLHAHGWAKTVISIKAIGTLIKTFQQTLEKKPVIIWLLLVFVTSVITIITVPCSIKNSSPSFTLQLIKCFLKKINLCVNSCNWHLFCLFVCSFDRFICFLFSFFLTCKRSKNIPEWNLTNSPAYSLTKLKCKLREKPNECTQRGSDLTAPSLPFLIWNVSKNKSGEETPNCL